MKHVLYIAITLFLITTYPMVSRVDAADPIPYEELVGVWTFTQNGFDHNLTENRVLELCKTVISVHYPDHHLGFHIRFKFFGLEVGSSVHTLEPCTFVNNVQFCRVESEESKDGKRTRSLYKKVRENVYDVSALKPDGKTVSKEQTIYACPVKIADVQNWVENEMEAEFINMKSRLVDGKWRWYGVLFERKVKGVWGWHQIGGDEEKDPRYSGEIKIGQQNSQPNGQGKWTSPNGNKYEGEWKDGKKHGHGTYTWSDGQKYAGEWKNSKRHGQGTFTWSDGKIYVGQWKDDKRNGQGTETSTNGKKYVGEWKDGRPHGKGAEIFPDGAKYEGELKNGRFNGQGTYTWSDGQKYAGEWKNSKRHGQGTRTWPDGRKYEGEWKDGAWHGQGTFIFPDGRKFVGEFKMDNPWDVTGYDKTGKIIAKWVNGKKQ